MKLNRRVKSIWMTGVTIGCCLVLILIGNHVQAFWEVGPFDYLGGPTEGGLEPAQLIWWLIIFLPIWSLCGWLLSRSYRDTQMIVFRYKNMKRWWQHLVVRIYFVHSLYFIGMVCMLRVMLQRVWLNKFYLVGWLLWNHSSLLIAIMIVCFVVSRNMIVAFTIPLLIEVFAKVPVRLGWVQPWIWPPVWGMYHFHHDL
jgi:hypothetical protein